MKKSFLFLLFAMSYVAVLNAQVDKRAIGVRFGGFSAYGGEITFQQPLSTANRLEIDLGLVNSSFELTGLYQWVKPLPQLYEGFSWYYGFGAGVGTFYNTAGISAFGVGAFGQIGLQYNFDFPLQLTLDYRPGIYVIPTIAPTYDGVYLAARYCF